MIDIDITLAVSDSRRRFDLTARFATAAPRAENVPNPACK